jgi:hypothetical protein
MDILERLTDDTLWIYTAILGSIAGAAFLFWFKDTRMAQWGVAKFDELETRIAFMEEIAHAPIEPGGATELKSLIDDINVRLDKIEKKRK